MKTIIKTIIPTAVLQEVMDAMDDMATDSRLLDMKQSRAYQFDAARDALCAALKHPDAGPPATAPEGWKLVPLEPTDAMLGAGLRHVDGMASMPSAYRAMLAAAPQPQSDATPYLYYDPENGDTWTQEAINDGCCPPDSLIALYTKDKK